MFENNMYTQMTNKWFDLANDAYRTYVKSLVWGQERSLEMTKMMIGQTDAYQGEGRHLVNEYSSELQRSQQLMQTAWQESVKGTMEMLNQYRVATNANIADLNTRLDQLQNKVEETNTATV